MYISVYVGAGLGNVLRPAYVSLLVISGLMGNFQVKTRDADESRDTAWQCGSHFETAGDVLGTAEETSDLGCVFA